MRAQLTGPDAPADHSRYHAAIVLQNSQVKWTRNFRYLKVTQHAIRHAEQRALAADLPETLRTQKSSSTGSAQGLQGAA
jgi:hypothetical protein